MVGFGERVAPTDVIKSILQQYPFSIAIFRELLQNSDDAKATKQIFVLDRRTRGTEHLIHEALAGTQGPALLAYNNAQFNEDDWEALQTIHRSSKKTDTSKIGKYGLGFRSCYHLTDNPQILSGSNLAILDPHHEFTESGGTRRNFTEDFESCADQLDVFDRFITRSGRTNEFDGTVIRMPLRTAVAALRSEISAKVVSPEEIRTLLVDLVDKELDVMLLFLRHLRSIEIYEIGDEGERCLGKVEMTKETSIDCEAYCKYYKCTVVVERSGSISAQNWRMLDACFPEARTLQVLSERLGSDVEIMLKQNKLVSDVSIAVPHASHRNASESFGRLFTYLPLPIYTGFPCHVHGLFALTPDRQNLCKGDEMGITKGSVTEHQMIWNRVVFDTFVPEAWAGLLSAVVEQGDIEHIYHLWPLLQNMNISGEAAYWSALPRQILASIIKDKRAVWPVVNRNESGALEAIDKTYEELSTVLAASSEDEGADTAALAASGVRITFMPPYICHMLSSNGSAGMLSPRTVHTSLLQMVTAGRWPSIGADTKKTILSYLLSSGDFRCIAGLPLVPTVNEQYVVLPDYQAGTTDIITHTLLTEADTNLWSQFDASAISLSQLPPSAAKLFPKEDARAFGLRTLTPEKVVDYVRSAGSSILQFDFAVDPSLTRTVHIAPCVLPWLLKFWTWLGGWGLKENTFPMLTTFYLVPIRDGTLRVCEETVFCLDKASDLSLRQLLITLHIPFLHPDFERCDFLRTQGNTKSVNDIRCLLQRIQMHDTSINEMDAAILRKHFVKCLSNPGHCRCADCQNRMRVLPIFRLRDPYGDGSIYQLSLVPEGNRIRCINDPSVEAAPIPRLPTQPQVYFDGSSESLALASYLNGDNTVFPILSRDDVLNLTIEHFLEQPKDIQQSLITYLVRYRSDCPPRFRDRLRCMAFVPVGSGTQCCAPRDIIDPESDIACLSLPNDIRRPYILDSGDKAIVEALRSLRCLITTLSKDLILERITYISEALADQRSAHELACNLLRLLDKSAFNCGELSITEARWLPASGGSLCGYADCYPPNIYPPVLFDRVVSVLQSNVNSWSLRKALGWDKPIPLEIVIKQFRSLVNNSDPPNAQTLSAVIRELAPRTYEGLPHVDELLKITSDSAWIPISSRIISKTAYAVFSSVPGLPFQLIPRSLLGPHVEEFLTLMGCTEKPSATVLLDELQVISWSARRFDPKTWLPFLRVLDIETLTDQERVDMLLPDSNCQFHPVPQLYFNDLGSRSDLTEIPSERLEIHAEVDYALATRLRIEFLSQMISEDDDEDEDEDMGEDLATRISNVLKQYSEELSFNEFFANAADAGARRLDILVDKSSSPRLNILSEAMGDLQSCPSLIIHNDAQFTKDDFLGIRRIGKGSKQETPNLIGRFGLGALSMFHFTEVAMIVSGSYVLFLNPSKSLLFPGRRRASGLLRLSTVRRVYADHLASVDGLFGFHTYDMEDYKGTIFRLPLRDKGTVISSTAMTTHRVDGIVSSYREVALQSLLFTRVDSVEAFCRDVSKQVSSSWAVSATRSVLKDEDSELSNIQIMSREFPAAYASHKWAVISKLHGHESLPEQFVPLIEKYRIPSSIAVGLAAQRLIGTTQHKLFSTLPLPITTSLPVHLHASFILAEDRRSIRLDGDESKFNGWLLRDLVPPVYIKLLQCLAKYPDSDKSFQWWPKTLSIGNFGFSSSFYKTYLPASDLKICTTVTGQSISPKCAVFLGKEPNAVAKVLRVLRPTRLVDLPPLIRIQALKGSVCTVDPMFVRTSFLENAENFISAWDARSGLRIIEEVLKYLLLDDQVAIENITSLPLLPLANGDLANFEEFSSTSRRIYIWQSQTSICPPFSADCFVHPSFRLPVRLIQNGKLNVSILNGQCVTELVRKHIPNADEIFMAPTDAQWVADFWSKYHLLPCSLKASELSSFPLVPTTRERRYVSLNSCCTAGVLLHPTGTDSESLRESLEILGATIVSKECPPSIIDALGHLGKERFTIVAVLRFLSTVDPASIATRLAVPSDTTTSTSKRQFILWARNQGWTTVPQSLISTARLLPIWRAVRKDARIFCVPACRDNLLMLPLGVDLSDVKHYLQDNTLYTMHSLALQHLGLKPLAFAAFRDHLDFGGIVRLHDMPTYRKLLNIILANKHLDSRPVPVPNNHGVLVQSSDLYAQSVPLFVSAFRRRDRFVHMQLLDWETRLIPFGIRRDVTFERFIECATAIHEDAGDPDIVERAARVFEYYNEELVLNIRTDSYKELESLAFVPRAEMRRARAAFPSESYAKAFPEVVAPKHLVRREYESIAWTQKALFRDQPNDGILRVHYALGVPSVQEVVRHLRTLVKRVAANHPSDGDVLSDLKATYQWLAGKVTNAEGEEEDLEHIRNMHDEELFLNVDVPELEPWKWTKADLLFFNTPDEAERQQVRGFLSPFKSLLLAAGAREIKNATTPPVLTSSDNILAGWRSSFNAMRLQHELTDVIIGSDDGHEFPAHRVVLAASSEFFIQAFCRGFLESNRTDGHISMRCEHSGACIKAVLDYVYSGTDEVSPEDLTEVLQLSHYWQLHDLNTKVQAHLVPYITLGTYDHLRDMAQEYQSTILTDACDEFERKNADVIREILIRGNQRI